MLHGLGSSARTYKPEQPQCQHGDRIRPSARRHRLEAHARVL